MVADKRTVSTNQSSLVVVIDVDVVVVAIVVSPLFASPACAVRACPCNAMVTLDNRSYNQSMAVFPSPSTGRNGIVASIPAVNLIKSGVLNHFDMILAPITADKNSFLPNSGKNNGEPSPPLLLATVPAAPVDSDSKPKPNNCTTASMRGSSFTVRERIRGSWSFRVPIRRSSFIMLLLLLFWSLLLLLFSSSSFSAPLLLLLLLLV
mmetsp:Transcript_1273/g.2584  ORF Transcript_1273/g.2584 Transcript_1273/m.2584 type:complete len:207 (+) Transcript_1273:1477-2097(+)